MMNTLKNFKHANLGTRLDVKNAVISVVTLIVGIALIHESINLQTATLNLPTAMLGGGVCAIVFAIVFYFIKGRALYFVPTESKIKFYTLHFDAEILPTLNQLINTGNISDSQKLHSKDIGNVRLEVLKANDNCFAAVQVSQYIDLAYVPKSEVRVMNIAEVENLLKHIKLS